MKNLVKTSVVAIVLFGSTLSASAGVTGSDPRPAIVGTQGVTGSDPRPAVVGTQGVTGSDPRPAAMQPVNVWNAFLAYFGF